LRSAVITAIAVLPLIGLTVIAEPISIQLEGGTFRVAGWNPPRTEPSKGWSSVFAVYAGSGDVPSLSGSYAVENGALVFRPRFPFAPGVQYRAVFRQPGSASPVEKIFNGPPRDITPLARVERIYPSTDVLPSNQLRLYIIFSAPMSRGEADARIHILDDKGKALANVFLPGEELWDPGFRRLTMTFDPGRIKRGLVSNESIGPPITEGRRYTLVIDRDWLDARGVRMVEGFRKSYRGGPAQRNPPDPAQWKVTAPKAGTSEPVAVNFPTPMNYALLQRMIEVFGPGGKVAGSAALDKQESEWLLTPQSPWKTGDYKLIVDTGLEDLAGNRIGQPFDIDVFDRVTERITTKTVALPFVVR
jgi:hypothetical protein